MNDFIHRLENNIQTPRRVTTHASSSQPVVLSFTREQLEQALSESEMHEILHNAGVDLDFAFKYECEDEQTYGAKLGDFVGVAELRVALIERLFMWASVNRSIE